MTQFATVDLNINSGWLEGSDGWKAGMDYNMVALSMICRGIVQNSNTNTIPATPTIGEDCFIVGDTPTGVLVGKENYIYFFGETAWYYLAPWKGARFYDQNLDDYIEYDGTSWIVNSNYKLKIKTITGTSYTVLDADSGYVLNFTNAAAIALTVNANAGESGFNFGIVQSGAGQITIAGAATLVNVDSHDKTFGLNAMVAFIGLGSGVVNYAGRTTI